MTGTPARLQRAAPLLLERIARSFHNVFLVRLRNLAIATLVLVLASSASYRAAANSGPFEWQLFRTLCSVVELEAPPDLESQVDLDRINRSVATAIEERLRQGGFDYPIEFGRSCFPGKVGIAPYQMSLLFHVTLAAGLGERSPPVAALIMHSYFRSVRNAPHEFPTRILFCGNDQANQLSDCLANGVDLYFEDTAWKIIKRGR
jgi:hypothetical protein